MAVYFYLYFKGEKYTVSNKVKSPLIRLLKKEDSILMAKPQKQNISGAVKAYSNRLFRFIRSRVPTTADAEDILQEVWYQFSKVVDTEPIEQVSAWLFRVARNRITDNYRKRKDELLDDFAYEDEDGEVLFANVLLAEFNTPETETMRQLFWDTLLEALEELPENQRDVFVLN